MELKNITRKLNKTLRKGNCENHVIIQVLTRTSRAQRLELVKIYLATYNRELIQDVRNELGGLFEDACVALLKSYYELSADIIHETFMSKKFSILPVIDVFFTNPPEEVKLIKETFIQKFGEDVGEYCFGIKDKDLAQIAHKIVTKERDESEEVDFYLAYEEAEQFNEAGLGLACAKQNQFLEFLCTRSFKQLGLTLKIYEKITGNHLEEGIMRYFDGDLHDIFSSLVKCIRSPTDYLAERIHNCLKDGSNDQTIINILISRCDKDLDQVQARYKSKFLRTLYSQIRESMKGDFRRLLMALCESNEPLQRN